MKNLLLLAGAAAFAIAAPALAHPGGGGGGGMHGGGMHGGGAMMAAHAPSMHANTHATAHASSLHARTHVRNAHATTHVRNAHATAHARGSRISARDQALAHKYGGALCAPGLAKKTPSCVPPGQAKRLFRVGQRVPTQYKYLTPYSDIPSTLINQYSLTDQYRYIYRNNEIYVIDPRTDLVTRIINAVL